jgi:hypothetical protein
MNESKIKFNPNVVTKPTNQKNDKKEKKSRKKVPKEMKSTREIPFQKNRLTNVVTLIFWGLFFISLTINTVFFLRQSYILDKINAKEVNPEEVVEQATSSLKGQENVQFYAKNFVKTLFNVEKEQRQQKAEDLNSQLATGLDVGRFIQTAGDTPQKVLSVELMDTQLAIHDNQTHYSFLYEVTFERDKQQHSIQLTLPVTFEHGDFKVMNYPTYQNVTPSVHAEKNHSVYKESDWYTKGKEVEREEKEKLEGFVREFFKLYVTNSENLSLIADVTGLNNGSLQQVTIKNTVVKEDIYVVEGTYQFTLEAVNYTSYFHLEINQTEDNYFVKKLSS